jgi:hypothetical protein
LELLQQQVESGSSRAGSLPMGNSAPVGMSIASHKAALVDLEGKFVKNMGQVAREVELFAVRLDRMDGVTLCLLRRMKHMYDWNDL